MRKLFFIILACAVFMCGCVSNEEYENMASQYQAQLAEKDEQIAEKDEQIKKLEDKIDNLRNDSSILLSRIREAYFLENYEKVVELYNRLHEIHPDSADDKTARELYKSARIEINVKREETEKRQKELRQEKVRNTIRIYKSYVADVDSAGGVDIQIAWENTSDKNIDYITFTVEVYNGVNDIISCEIKDTSTFKLKETGPIYPGGGTLKSKGVEFEIGGKPVEVDNFYGSTWENVLYNNTAKKVLIKNILIEYSDDSTARLSGDDIELAFY